MSGGIVAVTTFALGARVAAGAGVPVVCSRDERRTAALEAAVTRAACGIISFGVAGDLAPGQAPVMGCSPPIPRESNCCTPRWWRPDRTPDVEAMFRSVVQQSRDGRPGMELSRPWIAIGLPVERRRMMDLREAANGLA
jgi:hypothetical protein